jgi:1-acyl-sn-glycerol-3-phosphate acyltransferase
MALLTDAWPLGWPVSDFGRINPGRKVHFAFGDPLWVDARGATANGVLIDFIQAHLRRWGVSGIEPPRAPG